MTRVLTSVTLLCTAALATALPGPLATGRRPRWHELTLQYDYAAYVQHFHADVASAAVQGSEEWARRSAIFGASLREIIQHNADPDQTWKQGVNQFTHLSHDEFRARLAKPSALARARQSMSAAPQDRQVAEMGALPKTVDWRTKGVLTAVKDQGSCGSCWAFASTAMVETYASMSRSPPVLMDLSPQQLVACAPNLDECGGVGGCDGSIPELAFDYVKDAGMTSEWTLPYTAHDGSQCHGNPGQADCPCRYNKTTMAKVELGGYTKLPANDMDAAMQALATVGPLAVNVQANTWSRYESGIFPTTSCGHSKDGKTVTSSDIDHVVQLVGYTPKAWIVRNSWTPTWGEDGFILLERAPSNSTIFCGPDSSPTDGVGCAKGPNKTAPVTTVCGTCAVLFDVSYPTGVKYTK